MIRKSRLSIAIQALQDIVDPIGKIEREMPHGHRLDGRMAIEVTESKGYLRDIAAAALREIRDRH